VFLLSSAPQPAEVDALPRHIHLVRFVTVRKREYKMSTALRSFVLAGNLFFVLVLALIRAGSVEAAPAARNCRDVAVYISSPQDGDGVSGVVSIIGSASLGPAGEFHHYELYFSGIGLDAWVLIVPNGRPAVIDGILAYWNTTVLPDGDYVLRLRAVDRAAQYCEDYSSPVHVQNSGPRFAPTSDQLQKPAGAPPTAPPARFAAPTKRPPIKSVPTVYAPTATDVPTAAGPAPSATAIPTIFIDVPTEAPTVESTLVVTTTARNAGQAVLPFDISSIGAAMGDFVSSLKGSFLFGIQLTAAVFILLGAIVFLRQNL
jgi:hypothetical protein